MYANICFTNGGERMGLFDNKQEFFSPRVDEGELKVGCHM